MRAFKSSARGVGTLTSTPYHNSIVKSKQASHQNIAMAKWPAEFGDVLLQVVDLVSEAIEGDLQQCGTDLAALTSLTSHLKSHNLASAPPSYSQTLSQLKTKCDEAFRSVTWREVQRCWRRLYTDVMLLWAVCDVVSGGEEFEETIHRLDLAIIVAGTPGRGRREVTLRLIALVQDLWDQREEGQEHGRPKKRLRRSSTEEAKQEEEKKNAPHAAHPPHVRAQKTIPVLQHPPSMEEFSTTHYKSPFILREFAKDWPAFDAHNDAQSKWASGDYLLSISGKGRSVPVEIGREYTDDEWTQRIMPWEEFLRHAGFLGDHSSDKDVYLAQHTLLDQLPSLQRDILIPDYVYAVPSDAAELFPCYTSPPLMTVEPRLDEEESETPKTRETITTSLWIGPKDTLSPAHTDPYFNCFVQVVGSKAVWIAPPDSNDEGGMYAFGGRDDTEEDAKGSPAPIDLTNLMTNTSRVPVFAQGPSPPLFEDSYPEFTDTVEPKAMHAVLRPGDLMFLPPGWWHSIKSLEKSVSVSLWF